MKKKLETWLDLAERIEFFGLRFEELEELGLRFKNGREWSGLVNAMESMRPEPTYERTIAVKKRLLKDFLEGDISNESDL